MPFSTSKDHRRVRNLEAPESGLIGTSAVFRRPLQVFGELRGPAARSQPQIGGVAV